MPNWIANRLTLVGPKNMLNSFVDQVGNCGIQTNGVWRYSILQSFFPTPEDFDLLPDEPFENSEFRTSLVMKHGVYSKDDWNLIHWGTIWADNIGEKGFVWQSPIRVLVCFDTVENPPIHGLQTISKEYIPRIEFNLYSYGIDHLHPFSCTIENGQVYNQKMFPKSGPSETIKESEVQQIEEQEVQLSQEGKSND